MAKKKKAQAENQVFIYLLTIIIIGLMFYFGIRWIMTLNHKTNEIAVVQLKVDLEKAFDEIRPSYLSSRYEEFNVPDGIKKICFVDQDNRERGRVKSKAPLCDKTKADYDYMICNAWDGSKDENVFFEPTINSPVYLGKISIGVNGYLCKEVQNGKIGMKLTGLGDMVSISDE